MDYKVTSIVIDNLSFAYHANDSAYVFKNISFEAKGGEIVVLRGESGTGKSTILQLIAGCVDTIGMCTGEIHLVTDNKTIVFSNIISTYKEEIKDAGIGMMFQNPMASFFDIMPVFDQLKLGVKKHLKCTDNEAEQILLEKLEDFNFQIDETLLKKLPAQFSGGELQRIDFAYFDIIQPQIILLDEPVSALDSQNWKLIEKSIKQFQQMGAVILIASHDNDFVAQLDAKIVDIGKDETDRSYEDFKTENQLLHNKIPAQGVDITVNISKSFQDKVLFRNLKFELNDKRRIIGLTGVSGRGKSTLLQIIAGLKSSDVGGDIAFSILKPKIQMVFQSSPQSLNPAYRVSEQLKGDTSKIESILQVFKLSSTLLDKYPGQLSGGQIQRFCFVRAVLEQPHLLLLDEPFVGLDAANKKILISIIKSLVRDTSLRCMITSHDHSALNALTTDIIEL